MPDTIAAIATGGVVAAIGILRVSGDDTLPIIDKVFKPISGKPMSSYPNRQLVYGNMVDADGTILDICLCTISRGPGSYTGEDTAELQTHGSPVVLRAGLEALFEAGARQARAGEFSKRAFLNGRMDLTQAEAVIDIIHSETAEAAKNAVGQLNGAILNKTDGIYNALVEIFSHYHAVLDYPDEDIEAWRNYLHTMPRGWICGYDKELRLTSERLYDLKAIPSLYLLDSTKRVIIKDGSSVAQLEQALYNLTQR